MRRPCKQQNLPGPHFITFGEEQNERLKFFHPKFATKKLLKAFVFVTVNFLC
jgi:hypothetical protein